MKTIFGGFGLAVLLLGAFLIYNSMFIINETQQALVLQFFKVGRIAAAASATRRTAAPRAAASAAARSPGAVSVTP